MDNKFGFGLGFGVNELGRIRCALVELGKDIDMYGFGFGRLDDNAIFFRFGVEWVRGERFAIGGLLVMKLWLVKNEIHEPL